MNQDSQKLADVGQHSRGISPENPVSRENKDSGKDEVSDIFFRSQLQKSLNLAQPVLSENVQRINLEKNQEPIILVLKNHELSVPDDEKDLKSTESVLKQLLPQKSKVQEEQGSYSVALKRKISPTDPRENKACKFNSKEISYPHDFICPKDGHHMSKRAEISQDYKSSTTSRRISPKETNLILPTDQNIILTAEQKWISPTYPQMSISSEQKMISPIDIHMQQPLGVHNCIPPISFDPDVKFQYLEPARVINSPEATHVSSFYVNKNDAPFLQDYDRRAVCTKDAFLHTDQPSLHQTSSTMPCHRDTIATNGMQYGQLADAETITANERLNMIYPIDVQMQQPVGVNKWIPPIYFNPNFTFQSLEPARVINNPETSYVSSLYVNKDHGPFFQYYDRCAGTRNDAFGYTVEQPIPHQTSSAMPFQCHTLAANAVQDEQLADAAIITAKDRLSAQNLPSNPECNVAMDLRGMSILSSGCDPQMIPQCFRDDSRHDRSHSYPSSEQMVTTFADKMLNESSHNISQRLQDKISFHLSDQQFSKYGTVINSSEIRRISADSERDNSSCGRGVMTLDNTADAVYHIQQSMHKPPSSVLKEIDSGPELAVLSDWTADDFLDLWDSSELLNKYDAIVEINDAELDHITGQGLSHNKADIVDQPRGDSPLSCIIATMTNLETFGSSVVGTFQPSANNLHVDAQTRNQQRPIQCRFEGTSESSNMMYTEPIQNLALREARIQQEEPQLASTKIKTEYYSDDKLWVADYRTGMSRDASSQTEPLPVKCTADKCQQIPESSITLQTPAQLDVPVNLFSLFEDLNE